MSMQDQNLWIDEYGNRHFPMGNNREKSELARGGQGVVYRTQDEDLAVKLSLDESAAGSRNMGRLFQHIRTLPLPKGIQISLPLSILRDEPGYVMKLLKGMTPFTVFLLGGRRVPLVDRLHVDAGQV